MEGEFAEMDGLGMENDGLGMQDSLSMGMRDYGTMGENQSGLDQIISVLESRLDLPNRFSIKLPNVGPRVK